MQDILIKNGILGVFVVALSLYILRVQGEHKKERKEWKETIEKQFEKMDKSEIESNKVMRDHTNIISELKGLLKGLRNER